MYSGTRSIGKVRMQQRKDFDIDKYISLLKNYKAKRPEKIYESLEKTSLI
jgi:hypothetical protein